MADLVTTIESQLTGARREAILEYLGEHPETTLVELHASGYWADIEDLRVSELVFALREVTAGRLERAKSATGDAFDTIVLEVLTEARGRHVGAKYLRKHVGGPRWKLQHSLGRLHQARKIGRTGTTCDTKYWAL